MNDKINFNENNENKIYKPEDNPSINVTLENKSDLINKIYESNYCFNENNENKI